MKLYRTQSAGKNKFPITQNENLIGYLIYEEWITLSVKAFIRDEVITILNEPDSISMKTSNKTKTNSVSISYCLNRNCSEGIQFTVNNLRYIFRYANDLMTNFVLIDELNNSLLHVSTKYSGDLFQIEYSIQSSNQFESLQEKSILVLIAVHLSNICTTRCSFAYLTT